MWMTFTARSSCSFEKIQAWSASPLSTDICQWHHSAYCRISQIDKPISWTHNLGWRHIRHGVICAIVTKGSSLMNQTFVCVNIGKNWPSFLTTYVPKRQIVPCMADEIWGKVDMIRASEYVWFGAICWTYLQKKRKFINTFEVHLYFLIRRSEFNLLKQIQSWASQPS